MKKLITTRADSTVLGWMELTHPVFRKYAEKHGADFMVLDDSYNCEEARAGIGHGLWHFRIMNHYDLHSDYDRIIHFDTDMLLMPDCPNLFDVVPYDSVGTILEDKGSRAQHRVNCMMNAQRQFGNIGWNTGYINTGVFVTSKCHRDIFQKTNGRYFTDWGTDDVHIGYRIKKLGYKIEELHYKFNHMSMYSEPWNNNPCRFDSHIIHYAGRGVFDDGISDKLEQAKMDYKRIYK